MLMPTPRVDLVYAGDCPNVADARAQLLRAFASAGLVPHWREWRVDDPACPTHLRRHGSPTILVAGLDVAGKGDASDASCCRVYQNLDGKLSGVPPVAQIANALRQRGSGGQWGLAALGGPALAVAFLPKLICPACWPAYAAAVTALGLTFLLEVRYLLPLTVIALSLAVGLLAWKARERRGYGPAALGLIASAIIIAGKFALDNSFVLYGGAGAFVAAFLWHSWPQRDSAGQGHCPACEPDASFEAKGDSHERKTSD